MTSQTNFPGSLALLEQQPKAQKIIGNYTLTSKILGKGQFGEVILAYSTTQNPIMVDELPDDPNDDKIWLACKVIKKSRLSKKLQEHLRSEIGILSKLQSPFVIRLYDIQKTANNFYLFMKYCNGGDLEKLHQIRGRFTEQEARFFMSQIVQGFKAINDLNVLHRDLKLANILVHFKNADMDKVEQTSFRAFKESAELVGNVEVVIADLGFAKQLDADGDDLTSTQLGTPLYMAPEIFKGFRYDSKVDVWSLGNVFYEMLTGFTPFTGSNRADLKRNLEKGSYRFPKEIKLSLEGLHFLNCCLKHDPKERISWDEILKHPYLNYDYKQTQPNNELMLSYREDSGMYSILQRNDPHHNLNEDNAILLNTKNNQLFEQTYDKTVQKRLQIEMIQHVEEQLEKEKKLNSINKSQILLKWEQDDEELKQEDLLPFEESKDVDKEFSQILSNEQQEQSHNNLLQTPGLDYDKINKLANEIAQRQSHQEEQEEDEIAPVAKSDALKFLQQQEQERKIFLSNQNEDPQFSKLSDLEDSKSPCQLNEFLDLKNDSIYPLITKDPDYAKEFTVKINGEKLDNIFGPNQHFNLQSVFIQNDYFREAKKQ